jgi:hypothetical protein
LKDLSQKLKNMEINEWYQIKISNKFVALENLKDDVDINRASANIRKNIKTLSIENLGHYEMR